jgi:hypothetical protein
MMTVGVWPILLLMMSDVWGMKASMLRDVEDGLYSRWSYAFSHVSAYPAYCTAIDIIFEHQISKILNISEIQNASFCCGKAEIRILNCL